MVPSTYHTFWTTEKYLNFQLVNVGFMARKIPQNKNNLKPHTIGVLQVLHRLTPSNKLNHKFGLVNELESVLP